MSVYFNPTSTIKVRLGIQNGGPAQSFLTNTCFKKMTKFVPGGTRSQLNQEVDIRTDKIIYFSPSAHYLFNGNLYVDPKTKKGAFYSPDYGFWSRPGETKINSGKKIVYHTVGTGAHWDKLMWTSQGDKVVKEVQRYIDRGCK